MQNKAKTVGTLIVLTLSCFVAAHSLMFPTFAESTSSSSSDVTVRVKDIITLRILDSTASSEIDNLSLSLTPTPNGTFTKGSFNVDASTSNSTGYKLYMTSIGTNPVSDTSDNSTYTTDLINVDNTISDSIPTLDTGSSITEADFRVRNSFYKNKWGYSLNGLSISDSTDPTTGAIVHTITENTDTSSITYTNIPVHSTNHEVGGSNSAVESDLTPVTIGVNVSNSVSSGTYKNALEFTAIANELPTEYSLKFNANLDGAGLDTEEARTTYHVEDMLDNLEAESYASSYSFTLPSGADNIPIKTNMVLREWNTRADGSGVSYQPGDNLELIVDDTDPYSTEATLYAIWTNDFFHLTYMQDMYPTVCAKLYTPSNAIGTNANAITLSSDNVGTVSGAGSTIAVADYNAYKNTVTANNTRAGDNQPYVAQRTLYDIRDSKPYTIRKLADSNCWMTSNLALALTTGVSVVSASNTSRDTSTFTPTPCSSNGACAMNGNTVYVSSTRQRYYSWYAVIAANNPEIAAASVNEDQPYSICPLGWRLPANYTMEEWRTYSYSNLLSAYLGSEYINNQRVDKSSNLEIFPMLFARDGYYGSGRLFTGSGYLSSSSYINSSAYAYNFSHFSSYTNPQNQSSKFYGMEARCVAV